MTPTANPGNKLQLNLDVANATLQTMKDPRRFAQRKSTARLYTMVKTLAQEPTNEDLASTLRSLLAMGPLGNNRAHIKRALNACQTSLEFRILHAMASAAFSESLYFDEDHALMRSVNFAVPITYQALPGCTHRTKLSTQKLHDLVRRVGTPSRMRMSENTQLVSLEDLWPTGTMAFECGMNPLGALPHAPFKTGDGKEPELRFLLGSLELMDDEPPYAGAGFSLLPTRRSDDICQALMTHSRAVMGLQPHELLVLGAPMYVGAALFEGVKKIRLARTRHLTDKAAEANCPINVSLKTLDNGEGQVLMDSEVGAVCWNLLRDEPWPEVWQCVHMMLSDSKWRMA